jgi:2-methylisocitrate lyase-like PEP mutase family enzyme
MGMPSRLRGLLQSERVVVAPVCCDPLTARLVESLGFKAAYLGGFALGAVTCLTEPLTNMSEMAAHAQQIARRINIPLIIDGNAGFGEPIHTIRAIQEFEWGGVAGTHIEDQYYPKRAHYHKGIEHIISIEEMAMKIRAAVRARQDKDFLIIARTDAMRTHGFDEGAKRGNAYVEAGADMVMCFPNTIEESQRAPQEIRAPLVYVNSQGNRLGRPIFSVQEFAEMGWKMVVEAITAPLVAIQALKRAYGQLANDGRMTLDQAEMQAVRKEIEDLIGLEEYYAIEAETVERP